MGLASLLAALSLGVGCGQVWLAVGLAILLALLNFLLGSVWAGGLAGVDMRLALWVGLVQAILLWVWLGSGWLGLGVDWVGVRAGSTEPIIL